VLASLIEWKFVARELLSLWVDTDQLMFHICFEVSLQAGTCHSLLLYFLVSVDISLQVRHYFVSNCGVLLWGVR
jgi:hypothetical protein